MAAERHTQGSSTASSILDSARSSRGHYSKRQDLQKTWGNTLDRLAAESADTVADASVADGDAEPLAASHIVGPLGHACQPRRRDVVGLLTPSGDERRNNRVQAVGLRLCRQVERVESKLTLRLATSGELL